MKNLAFLLLIFFSSCRENTFDPTKNSNDQSSKTIFVMSKYEWKGTNKVYENRDCFRLLEIKAFPLCGTVYYFDGFLKNDSTALPLIADSLNVVTFERAYDNTKDTVVFVTKGNVEAFREKIEDVFHGNYAPKYGIYWKYGFYNNLVQVQNVIHHRSIVREKNNSLHRAQDEWRKLVNNNILENY